MTRLAQTLPVALVSLLLAAPSPAQAQRWPTWPTELAQVREALEKRGEQPPAVLLQLLHGTAEYPDALVRDLVLEALNTDDPELQRWALGECRRRRLGACSARAIKIWNEALESSVRSSALAAIAMNPSPEGIDALFEGLDDPNEIMRAHAASLVSRAPLEGDALERARKELGARLKDESARVRKDAASALGRLGAGDGSFALIALLEDPDMHVREVAARALGALEDPRAAAPLRRLLGRAPTPNIARAAVASLARIPGEESETLLLTLLDAPPTNLDRDDVVRAIGTRAKPSETLCDALIDRLREPGLRDKSLQALLLLGDAALPSMRRGLERGLEPHVQLEVERLVRGREVETGAGTTRDPTPMLRPDSDPDWDDRGAWARLLARPENLAAGARLGTHDPPWLRDAAAGALAHATHAEEAAPWMVALALAPRTAFDPLVSARLASFALDEGADGSGRCLALWALGRDESELATDALARAAADASGEVRACAATSSGRHNDARAVALATADPDPRVRAAAALGARGLGRIPRRISSRLRVLAAADPHPGVRAAAAWIVTRESSDSWTLITAHTQARWIEVEPWGEAKPEIRPVGVVLVGRDRRRVALAPLDGSPVRAADTAGQEN